MRSERTVFFVSALAVLSVTGLLVYLEYNSSSNTLENSPVQVPAGWEKINVPEKKIIPYDYNHTFILKLYPSAGNVMVTGSFNQWNADGWRMTKKDGQWILPVHLNPGKYTYKFVVDGKWIMDPMNDLWEDNEYGTGNSVVWIEP